MEEHKDSFPHIHALLQFPDARVRCENYRYFDRALYKKWKSNWSHGHSDYQKPRNGSQGAVPYLMKYLLKNQTSKTVWKKVMPVSSLVEQPKNGSNQEQIEINSKNTADTSESIVYPVRLNGVKLASWSRNFDWKPLRLNVSK